MTDELSKRHGLLLTGVCDCVDRIVLNAYFSLGRKPGGFRAWWQRPHQGSEEQLDNTHVMRLAGRFSRRVRGFAGAHGIRSSTAAGASASTASPRPTWPPTRWGWACS